MTPEQQEKADMAELLERASFRRFLFRVIQSAGIFTATTDGSKERDQFNLGRRNLGLEILDMAERGQPIPDVHPAGPLLTIIQAFREETNQHTLETHDAKSRSAQFDRSSELGVDDDAEDDDAPGA
jgi:hypothetical protein